MERQGRAGPGGPSQLAKRGHPFPDPDAHFVAGMVDSCLTGDIFDMFVWFEVMG